MDALAVSETLLSPVTNFEEKAEIRAEKHEHLRGRNNVTSCRSPTREFDTKLIKNNLKEKRQQEFLRRRSVSPDLCGSKSAKREKRKKATPRTFSMKHHTSVSKSETLHTNFQSSPTANGHPVMILTPNSSMSEVPSTSTWAAMWSEQVTLTNEEKGQRLTPTSKPDTNLHRMKSKRDNRVNAQKTSVKTTIQTERIHQRLTQKNENILHTKAQREASVQTESGFVTIKESDVHQLADYLQEALWREEAVKKKLAALQESTTNLLNSSNKIWTARCSEDLLKNKIKALEAQLQVCLQKFPKDGLKKLVLQMEKQKLVYEEKALVALQKATQEKTEALSRAESLQEALITVQAEALRWQSLYEELKVSSGRLRENQNHKNDKLQQLHDQMELSRVREAELQQEVVLLKQEKKELQYNMSLLEEDNDVLREEIQQLRDDGSESLDLVLESDRTSEQEEPRLTLNRNTQVEEQLRVTLEKLRLKEKECEELQTELHVMEQECQSSQARLSQCRDELRQLSQRHRRPTLCGSWWRLWLLLLLLFAVVGVALLWLWHPPFRDQVEDLYSDMQRRVEDYLMEMASPRHSGCFRPI
ncbi:TRAF3-interacting JNK-activating modulator [Sphaeramia orbicularis]|uniref:TRAF3-interacting JNK-activating modulator-like n=1 Tax=Sphaeramia orbicularis TaxID=375764 RepID=A0A672YWL7_9TELE|nr:TRAF3-interacting JNK-activating modulator-like [Sphaeramia orbicularis]